MMACVPPLRKKSRTAYPSALPIHSPPKMRSKSPKLLIVVDSSVGPRSARPTNAAIDVPTPVMVMVCTPLGTSSM
ncbi:hypothetical protein [Bradyrhizobium sp. 2S1]|uniref:hypothetical protein n=1 Tax=Bradyrhizobium sp. 2S1 TaxID=1404429 RepID=UPI001AEE1049|nr:hypothetical protein [Bradyrhizobium sp. 2S1]MCK7668286.1 hypothetical protein [Bradyrhizobium sp. 2S1]